MFERQAVAVSAEACHHGHGNAGDVAVMAEFFARMHVGNMHFDHRQFSGAQGVAQGNRGVGPGARVDHHCRATAARLVNPVDGNAFVVGLAKFDFKPERGSAALAQGVDVREGFVAIGSRFAGAEHVEVRAVKHQNGTTHRETPLLFLVCIDGASASKLY